MEGMVYLGLFALMLVFMALFAIAEECVRLRRLREAEEVDRELWRSGGIVKGGEFCREAAGLPGGAHNPAHVGSIPTPAPIIELEKALAEQRKELN